MRLILALLLLFGPSAIPPVFITLQAAQVGGAVQARIALQFTVTSQAHAAVQVSDGLELTGVELPGAACAVDSCDITAQSGATVVMTATATVRAAGQQIVAVVVGFPDQPGMTGAVLVDTLFVSYAPLLLAP